jgi:hypothetical protein
MSDEGIRPLSIILLTIGIVDLEKELDGFLSVIVGQLSQGFRILVKSNFVIFVLEREKMLIPNTLF